MTDLATHIKPMVDAVNAATAEFERLHVEFIQHDGAIARFENCRDASRQLADAENATLRGLFKKIASPKEALKHQAVRNGHLEDAENFQVLADEQRKAKKYCTVELNMAAHAVRHAISSARLAAIEYLREAVLERLPVEYFQLVELVGRRANCREDASFNADPTVSDPIEFALREAGNLIRTHVMSKRDLVCGSISLHPNPPAELGMFNMSMMQINALKSEIAADESR